MTNTAGCLENGGDWKALAEERRRQQSELSDKTTDYGELAQECQVSHRLLHERRFFMSAAVPLDDMGRAAQPDQRRNRQFSGARRYAGPLWFHAHSRGLARSAAIDALLSVQIVSPASPRSCNGSEGHAPALVESSAHR